MKKFILLLILFSFVQPSQAWWWDKTDRNLEIELQGKGYAGTLPNLSKKISTKENKISTPIYEAQEKFNDPSKLKPVPKDNPAFIDIISKKNNISNYVLDINDLIPIAEKLIDCIEDESSVQLFVTRANVLSMNIDYLISKYDGKPECYYESFKKILEINGYLKSISQLRREAQVYQRYLAYQTSGSIYNPENINQQLQYLQEELKNMIIILRNEE